MNKAENEGKKHRGLVKVEPDIASAAPISNTAIIMLVVIAFIVGIVIGVIVRKKALKDHKWFIFYIKK